MNYGAAFYSKLWTALRERWPDLPTTSGFMRSPDEIDQTYIGHELLDGVYVHLRVAGRGKERELQVNLYGTDRQSDEWHLACHLLNVLSDTPLRPDPKVGGQAGRMRHAVAVGVTADALWADRDALFAAARPVYARLLDLPTAAPAG